MILTVRTLRTDGTVTTTEEKAPRYRKPANALAYIGTKLRRADDAVAACRANEITPPGQNAQWTWLGNHNDDQIAAHARITNRTW